MELFESLGDKTERGFMVRSGRFAISSTKEGELWITPIGKSGVTIKIDSDGKQVHVVHLFHEGTDQHFELNL